MITILPYSPTWRDEFVRIGVPIRHALGELALRIDHIESKAVPGLAGMKPSSGWSRCDW